MTQQFVDTREFLSQTKFYEGYSRFMESENRYESWDEAVDRVIDMHEKNYINNVFFCNQKIHDELKSKNQFIKNKAVLYENIYKGNQKNFKNLDELDFNIITYSENSTD